MTISYQNKTYKLTSELEGAIISFINPEQNYTKYIYPYRFIINIRLKSTQLIITQIFKKKHNSICHVHPQCTKMISGNINSM